MPSTKSRPKKVRHAHAPQRSNGKLRVAAILKAGAIVIAEKGYEAATMAEIAARSDTKIGSLYRFFPNKETLANALIAHYHEGVDRAFKELNAHITSMSTATLTDALLGMMNDLRKNAGPTVLRLLESSNAPLIKRGEFRRSFHKHISRTLRLYSPHLSASAAQDIAVVMACNMKAMAAAVDPADPSSRPGAVRELHDMTLLYLKSRLKQIN